MNWERCQDLLIEYAHHELGGAGHTNQAGQLGQMDRMDQMEWIDREAVSGHLGQCGECATAYCRLRVDLADIAVAHAEAPAPEVAQRVRAAAQAEFAPSAWSRFLGFWSRPVPIYRAVAIAVVPIAVWVASERAGDEIPVEAPTTKAGVQAEIRLRNYDATATPAIYRGVL